MKVIDLNVLLYAINSDSKHHKLAKALLEDAFRQSEPVSFAWVVILGFMRISTNPRIMPCPLKPERAMAIMDEWLSLPGTERLEPGREHWTIFRELIKECGTAGNLTTDAHLAALAIENGAKLISFDRDFQRFKRLKHIYPEI